MDISNEAVEAAAAAMWERRPMTRDAHGAPTPFNEAKHYQRDRFLGQARASLEAAAPHLMTAAWSRGYNEGGAEFEVDNPRRSAGAGE